MSAQCRLGVRLTPGGSSTAEWREGGDSNPRRDLTSLTRLAGGRFQPLSHLPVGGPVYVLWGGATVAERRQGGCAG